MNKLNLRIIKEDLIQIFPMIPKDELEQLFKLYERLNLDFELKNEICNTKIEHDELIKDVDVVMNEIDEMKINESQETKSPTSLYKDVSDSSPDTLPKFKAKERLIKHEKRK